MNTSLTQRGANSEKLQQTGNSAFRNPVTGHIGFFCIWQGKTTPDCRRIKITTLLEKFGEEPPGEKAQRLGIN